MPLDTCRSFKNIVALGATIFFVSPKAPHIQPGAFFWGCYSADIIRLMLGDSQISFRPAFRHIFLKTSQSCQKHQPFERQKLPDHRQRDLRPSPIILTPTRREPTTHRI